MYKVLVPEYILTVNTVLLAQSENAPCVSGNVFTVTLYLLYCISIYTFN
jgi:hypothetical protein